MTEHVTPHMRPPTAFFEWISQRAFFVRTAKTLIRLGETPRLIRVFTGRQCNSTGFITVRYILSEILSFNAVGIIKKKRHVIIRCTRYRPTCSLSSAYAIFVVHTQIGIFAVVNSN